jgi:hypothetical protein
LIHSISSWVHFVVYCITLNRVPYQMAHEIPPDLPCLPADRLYERGVKSSPPLYSKGAKGILVWEYLLSQVPKIRDLI